MIDLSEKCFMMIEPVSSKKEVEINDKISNLVEEIMKNIIEVKFHNLKLTN